MKQDAFVARHRAEWDAFERWLDTRGDSARRARTTRDAGAIPDSEIPARYRRLTQQLALAARRGYSTQVTARLQALMQRGHAVLYRTPAPRWRRVAAFFLGGFPRLVREEWRCMLAAAIMLYVPGILVFAAIQIDPDLSSAIFPPEMLAQFESMYDPADAARKLGRDSGTDIAMFGFYIFNNISIAFKTFASGALAAIGSIFVLLQNGLIIGGVAGHLQAVGRGDPFWRFVCGHSAFELTAIVIAGGAGLQIGLRMLAPGQQRRIDALIEAGRRGALLSAGVFAMLVIAAFLEAFWSSIGWMPAAVKYSVAAMLWSLVGLWLWRGGRGLLPGELEGPQA
ncbi:stage II sporulation protein M [Lysobacter sp. TY2-98]|uniref:stage II sporulation protein M n=1 Tax=Lysobacter sp. TY2-98 TaxID=2290922 RepID=UPI000E1FE3ED|nr:stage II sporulation protein M [Lysobacter sp. TY2-98]AXK73080.1 stage II sporulation protein M [Lysobacter sp. TY2-98]